MNRLSENVTRCELRSGVLENSEYADIAFDFVAGSSSVVPSNRPLIRNVRLTNVAQLSCHLWGAVLDNVVVDGLKRLGKIPAFLNACVFRRVVLSGPISAIKINPEFGTESDRVNAEWNQANVKFYKDVDWAIDVREAAFKGSISLEGIPGALVRRDPDTQILVSRSDLVQSDWQSLDYAETSVKIAIEWFLERSPYEDCVIVAPKLAKYFSDELKVFAMLRRTGIAI